MKISDAKIIEFLGRSPLKSFEAMRDALQYLDGVLFPEGAEYELLDEGFLDRKVRVPNMRDISAVALLRFTKLCVQFDLIQRRHGETTDAIAEPEEIIAYYELTDTGRTITDMLEAIEQAKQ